MSLFDILGFGGRKVEPLSTFPDTVPNEDAVGAPAKLMEEPVAAWPFPTAGHPKEGPGCFDAKPEFDPKEEGRRKAVAYERLADERRQEMAELKELVKEAPEHGIHFYHAGKTTIAWRHHNQMADGEWSFIRNPRLIDISTSICNPRDNFSKWLGSAYAMQALLDGRYITVKAREGSSIFDGETWKSPSDMVSIQDAIELIGLAIET